MDVEKTPEQIAEERKQSAIAEYRSKLLQHREAEAKVSPWFVCGDFRYLYYPFPFRVIPRLENFV